MLWQDTIKVLSEGSFPNRDELNKRIAPIKVMPKTKSDSLNSLYALGEILPSEEYGSQIVHSIETNKPRVIYGNINNNGLISNLPDECCVEVPCDVDSRGIRGQTIGRLPVQLAALIQTNVLVQSVAVEGILTRKKDLLVQATLLDPHTAAELSTDEIVAMVHELLDAHRDWLPLDFQ